MSMHTCTCMHTISIHVFTVMCSTMYVLMFILHVCFLSYVYLLLVCYAHDFPCTCTLLPLNILMKIFPRVQCEQCLCWQHGECIDIREDTLPEKYLCCFCTNPPGKQCMNIQFVSLVPRLSLLPRNNTIFDL